MRIKAEIVGTSFLSQSRMLPPKGADGTHDDHERDHWREKCHADADGTIFIPAICLHLAMVEATKRAGLKHGKASLSKYVEAGMMLMSDVSIGVNVRDVQPITLMCSSLGKKGAYCGSRVPRTFPMIPPGWRGALEIEVFEPILCGSDGAKKLRQILEHAGVFCGVGRWRPQVGGYNGRFKVESFEVAE